MTFASAIQNVSSEVFIERELVFIEDISTFSTSELLNFLTRFEDQVEWLKNTTKPYFDNYMWYYADELDEAEKMVDSIRDELECRGVYP